MHPRRPALVLGIAIEDLTTAETIDTISDLIDAGRREHRSYQVATVNVDFVVNALADRTVHDLLQRADVCIADGMPIVWAARVATTPLRERVTGADLVPALAEHASKAGWRMYLFGSAEGTAEQAAALLMSRHPGTIVVGVSGPFINDMDAVADDVLQHIIDFDPDILCVALGNPKQERFIDTYRDRLRTPVMIGVGGTLDLLIGDKKRAAPWMQKAGLEWVVRAVQEPGRLLRRYARDAWVFLPSVSRYIARARRSRRDATLRIQIDGRVVTVTAASSTGPSTQGWDDAVGILDQGGTLRIDLATCAGMQPTALSELIGLLHIAARYRSTVEVGELDPRLTKQIALLGLAAYLDRAETID